jgi:hypothetical protein
MIIYNILFYIKCIENLSPIYHQDEITKKQKKTISDMVKIWLFYNSSGKLFWTRMTSDDAKSEKKVAEHQYSNLSSAKYMLSKDKNLHSKLFCELSKVEKICEIIKFMQWNYTTSKENQYLKPHQEYDEFYKRYNGDPKKAYNAAGIKLTGDEKNLSGDLNNFLKNQHEVVFEVKIKKQLLCNFVDNKNFSHFELNDNQAIFISNKEFMEVIKDIIMCISPNKSNGDNFEPMELKKILNSQKGSINIYTKGFDDTLFCLIHDA